MIGEVREDGRYSRRICGSMDRVRPGDGFRSARKFFASTGI